MTLPARIPVAIVGGGPAGAAAACRLAAAGVPALLIERTGGAGNPVGETLDAAAGPLLTRLGLAGALAASAPLPSNGNRSRWGGPAVDERSAATLAAPFGGGWHLDRPAFNAAMLGAAAEAGTVVATGARLAGIAAIPGGGWRLRIAADGGASRSTAEVWTVDAGFVIDAGGRAAPFARRLGVLRRRMGSLTAAWATLPAGSGSGDRDSATVIEAAERGWWYVAALPGGRVAAAWFSDPRLAAGDQPWRPASWRALLAPADLAREALAGAEPAEGEIRIAAAGPSRLAAAAGDGWLAAGDAAATHDPLSGQGIGSALASGLQAADALIARIAGDPDALAAYAARVVARHDRDLRSLAAVYALEQRWPDAPFWRIRSS